MVSPIFDPTRWSAVPGFDFQDITYHRAVDQGTVRIAFNRPEVRNAFRPRTVDELYARSRRAHHDRRGLRAHHRQRPFAEGRRLGVLLGRRSAHPRSSDGYKYEGETAHKADPAGWGACTSSRCSG
jgi:naphthoate synthase